MLYEAGGNLRCPKAQHSAMRIILLYTSVSVLIPAICGLCLTLRIFYVGMFISSCSHLAIASFTKGRNSHLPESDSKSEVHGNSP